MIKEIQGLVQAELELVHEDVNKLRFNLQKVLDHISVWLDRFKNIIPSAVVLDKIAQLRKEVNVSIDVRNTLSNKMDLHFSRVADRIAIVELNTVSVFTRRTTAQVPRKGLMLTKRNTYLLNTYSGFSEE